MLIIVFKVLYPTPVIDGLCNVLQICSHKADVNTAIVVLATRNQIGNVGFVLFKYVEETTLAINTELLGSEA